MENLTQELSPERKAEILRNVRFVELRRLINRPDGQEPTEEELERAEHNYYVIYSHNGYKRMLDRYREQVIASDNPVEIDMAEYYTLEGFYLSMIGSDKGDLLLEIINDEDRKYLETLIREQLLKVNKGRERKLKPAEAEPGYRKYRYFIAPSEQTILQEHPKNINHCMKASYLLLMPKGTDAWARLTEKEREYLSRKADILALMMITSKIRVATACREHKNLQEIAVPLNKLDRMMQEYYLLLCDFICRE